MRERLPLLPKQGDGVRVPEKGASRLTGMEAILALWVATLSTDRLDLLGGEAGFVLTPYLALTPLVLLLGAFRGGLNKERRDWNLPEGVRPYALLLLALVTVTGLSSLLGLDPPMALRRTVHFLAAAGGTFLVVLLLVARERWKVILSRGAELGLALTLLFTILTAWAALAWTFPPVVRLGPATLDLTPATYGGFIPRLSGTVADPNRAGMDILVFLYFLARWGRPGPRRDVWLGLGLIMALATLSRSFLLAALALAAGAWLTREGLRVSRGAALAGFMALALGAGLFLGKPEAREAAGSALAPLSSRFSLQEESTRDHLRLMVRGLEEGTASVRRAALGIGYGNAHLVLQDVFPGNRYGNFHSLYITLLVETGVFSLLLFLILLARPLARGGPFMPLVAALAAFNIFYQAGNSPLQWAILALAWLVTVEAPASVSESERP
jgi:hypothetical protein